jgi:D-glycero-D-manno-heptose 1,7-bisphosphate phosphatase
MYSENKAVFLDRDGVLSRERGDYTWLLEDVEINNGVEEALLELANAGYKLIVISNQSGISKGIYSVQQADIIHSHLSGVLRTKGIYIEEFYYCPHHPTVSNCICRKPDSLLLEKAISRFCVNPAYSWFIGDADRDMEAGKKAGVNTYKLNVNGNLKAVVDLILKR